MSFTLEPSAVLTYYRCHCRECQKQASSAFGLSLKIPRAAARIAGALGQWQRVADSGKASVANFCATCGCRIYHGSDAAEVLSFKAGLIDQIAALNLVGNIWTDSALPWVDCTDGICYRRQPPDYTSLIEAWLQRRPA